MNARDIWQVVTTNRPAAAPARSLDTQAGGASIRVHLHGETLAEVMAPPFVEAAPAHTAPALTIHAWASAPQWPTIGGRAVDGDGLFVAWEEHWCFGFDPQAGEAFFVVPDARTLPTWSIAHPMVKLLHPWLRTRGVHVVHGAAVGVCGRGVLVVGRGGSGKSTLAVRAALAGMDYLGDDYVAVHLEDRRAFGLYRVAKLEATHLAARVPDAESRMLPEVAGLPKRLLNLPLTPLPEGLVLVGLVLPQVTGAAQSVAERVGPGRALRALAPSTLLQLPGYNEDFSAMATLVRQLPAWHLPLGPDLAGAQAALERLCTQA